MREACFITGAHVDQTARLSAPTRPGYSNPGTITLMPGGAGLNAATAAAALGLSCSIAGPVGRDAGALLLHETLARRGIGNALAPMEGARTGMYAATVDMNGDLVLGVADLALYDSVDAKWLFAHCAQSLERADCWFLNANLAAERLNELAGLAGSRFLAACTVSPAKAPRLLPVVGRLDLLCANLVEARSLAGSSDSAAALADRFAGLGAKAGVITDGGRPAAWWSGDRKGTVTPPVAQRIVDVVGAGDALAGTVLAGIARGLAMEQAVRYGIASAQATIASPEPAREDLSWEMLEAASAAP